MKQEKFHIFGQSKIFNKSGLKADKLKSLSDNKTGASHFNNRNLRILRMTTDSSRPIVPVIFNEAILAWNGHINE